jgi:hypothetical protein
MYPKGLSTIACAALVSVSSIALAGQTQYRCGNKYQDAPCDNGEQGARVGNSDGATPVPVQSQAQMQAVSADCSARGKESLKISRARESGATADKQLAEVDSSKLSAQQAAQEKRLISSVYAKRASATAIRADIEAECMAEKEKLKQALLLVAAVGKLMQNAQPDAAPGAEPDTTSPPGQAEDSQADARDRHVQTCARLTRELTSVRTRQRSGGSIAAMTKLNDSRRELEAGLRNEGC